MRVGMIVVAVLVTASAAAAQTHAPWPTNWNNWNDPALWCIVGDPGNAGEPSGQDYPPGAGASRVCGAVAYTYQIGKFEVTAGQYTAFLNAVAKTDTYGLYDTRMADTSTACGIILIGYPGNYRYTVDPAFANRPVNYVSWGDAARFVNWLQNGQPVGPQNAFTTEAGTYTLNGAMTDAELMAVAVPSEATRAAWANGTAPHWLLTSEDEWYKAAYYKSGSTNAGYWDYATRSNIDIAPGRDMADPSGNNVNYHYTGSSYPIDSGIYTTLSGEFQNSGSPYGTFDQGGNVREWNDTDLWGIDRGVRGGSLDMGPFETLAGCRRYIYPTYAFFDTGFRIAYVPEPATVSLLALSGLVMLRKRGK